MNGWTAIFRDGPRKGEDSVFAVGEPWEVIEVADVHVGTKPGSTWVIVGGDGMPELDRPWPDQARYRRVDVDHRADEDVAYYEVVAMSKKKKPIGPITFEAIAAAGYDPADVEDYEWNGDMSKLTIRLKPDPKVVVVQIDVVHGPVVDPDLDRSKHDE